MAHLTLTPTASFQMLYASLVLIYQRPELVTWLYLTSERQESTTLPDAQE